MSVCKTGEIRIKLVDCTKVSFLVLTLCHCMENVTIMGNGKARRRPLCYIFEPSEKYVIIIFYFYFLNFIEE